MPMGGGLAPAQFRVAFGPILLLALLEGTGTAALTAVVAVACLTVAVGSVAVAFYLRGVNAERGQPQRRDWYCDC